MRASYYRITFGITDILLGLTTGHRLIPLIKDKWCRSLMSSWMSAWTSCRTQTLELPVIKAAITLMWRYCNRNWTEKRSRVLQIIIIPLLQNTQRKHLSHLFFMLHSDQLQRREKLFFCKYLTIHIILYISYPFCKNIPYQVQVCHYHIVGDTNGKLKPFCQWLGNMINIEWFLPLSHYNVLNTSR